MDPVHRKIISDNLEKLVLETNNIHQVMLYLYENNVLNIYMLKVICVSIILFIYLFLIK